MTETPKTGVIEKTWVEFARMNYAPDTSPAALAVVQLAYYFGAWTSAQALATVRAQPGVDRERGTDIALKVLLDEIQTFIREHGANESKAPLSG